MRRLLPPAALVHHVRRSCFSGGSALRGGRRQQRAASFTAGPGAAEEQAGQAGEREEEEQQEGRPPPLPHPVASAPELGMGQGDAAEEDAEAAVELRHGYLRLACTVLGESAAVAPRPGAPAAAGAQAGQPPAAGSDDGLGADLAAVLSLASDCATSITAGGSGAASDAQLLQELLSLLLLPLLRRDSLARLPLLYHLRRQGGPALLLPLLRLEQQQLRLLGLRAITAALAGSNSSSGGGGGGASSHADAAPGRRRSVGSPPPAQPQLQAGGQAEEVIAAAGQLLAGFPLTAATRIALAELLCDGAPWPQVGCVQCQRAFLYGSSQHQPGGNCKQFTPPPTDVSAPLLQRAD